jgi:hypothetical protein
VRIDNAYLVGFTGHEGLRPPTMTLIKGVLRDRLARLAQRDEMLVGVTMLGPGADQLFARVMLEVGGFLCVVVPARLYRSQFEDEDAKEEYDRLYEQASYFEPLDYGPSTMIAHMEGARVVVHQSDKLLAVWDGQPARGRDGTADVVAYARDRGMPVEVIWPEGATRD